MKIKGIIYQTAPMRSGTRKDGTQWQSLPFYVRSVSENPYYPDMIKLETYDTVTQQDILSRLARSRERDGMGAEAEITIRCSLREYNGEHYNDLRVRSIIFTDAAPAPAPKPAPAPAQAPAPAPAPAAQPAPEPEAPVDDLPF